VQGFRSGDLVRATGSCDIFTKAKRVGGVSLKYCQRLQGVDGYRYSVGRRALPPPAEARSLRAPQR